MAKTGYTLEQAEELVNNDDRLWWDGWTLCSFRPGRGAGVQFRNDAYYNRAWRGNQKWGTIRRIEPNSHGIYYL